LKFGARTKLKIFGNCSKKVETGARKAPAHGALGPEWPQKTQKPSACKATVGSALPSTFLVPCCVFGGHSLPFLCHRLLLSFAFPRPAPKPAPGPFAVPARLPASRTCSSPARALPCAFIDSTTPVAYTIRTVAAPPAWPGRSHAPTGRKLVQGIGWATGEGFRALPFEKPTFVRVAASIYCTAGSCQT